VALALQPHLISQSIIRHALTAEREIIERIQAVILLGGSLLRSPLSTATGRSLLDLPVASGRSIFDCWHDHLKSFTSSTSLGSLTARLIIDRRASEPQLSPWEGPVNLSVEHDPHEYRGTAGVLRDVSCDYDDDDYIVVASAAQILLEPVEKLVCELASKANDISLVAHDDGTPCGLMLMRCGCLREIPAIGYIDLKEQAFPEIAKRYRVHVVRRVRPSGLPIRTLEDYVEALRAYRRLLAGNGDHRAEEDSHSLFEIVEDGAVVNPGSRLHDSVVLRGGRVEGESVLLRSIVGPQGIVRHKTLVCRIISGAELSSERVYGKSFYNIQSYDITRRRRLSKHFLQPT
jgi:NDP-sugar pyrophosphorylase family protein